MAMVDALRLHFERYLAVLQLTGPDTPAAGAEFGNEHLAWMCRQALEHLHWPSDKLNRWLGFVQGVMAIKGLVNVGNERAFSRPVFHGVYQEAGALIPATIEDNGLKGNEKWDT